MTEQTIHLRADSDVLPIHRSELIEAVRKVMLDSHSSYFMRWEIRADSTKDMSEEVAAMFVDELIIPALERLNDG